MYGLINQSLRNLVESRKGVEAWGRILQRTGLPDMEFEAREPYDDAITYALVGACSEELGVSPEAFLESFGRHWILETAPRTYGALMKTAGDTLPAFLRYLPRFHDRIAFLFPNLSPPTFQVQEEAPNSLVLVYHTHRPGLQPFVRGLLLGLGERFQTPVEVTLRAGRETGLGGEEFLVRW